MTPLGVFVMLLGSVFGGCLAFNLGYWCGRKAAAREALARLNELPADDPNWELKWADFWRLMWREPH